MWRVEVGDCRRVMADMPDGSVGSVVCDPPYELGFMGKSWDASGVAYDVGLWAEVLRLLKPGGHLLAFGGSRTYHRLACAVEDAGFEIRDQIMWVYGSGFPKSLNIGKQPGCERWEGWGTALKPAHEPVVVARKPLVGTVAANVLEYGTGGLNIDGCRIPTADRLDGGHSTSGQQMTGGWDRPWMHDPAAVERNAERSRAAVAKAEELGRWPANLIHDGSDEVLALFPDAGADSAARFFYCAKAGKKERNAGLNDFPIKQGGGMSGTADKTLKTGSGNERDGKQQNHHPTVKPIALMRYLVRLVTPPNGTVLDPFCGSGSTGKAAVLEGFSFIGIEQDAEYADIAKARIRHTDERR